jgi:CRISPR/Cas system-associated exonuclease Cas4 (RecB family)
MTLPARFQFSQRSLQDYVDCPRRFQLLYVLGVSWPSPRAEPALEFERDVRAGQAFHHAVHQYLLGVDVQRSTSAYLDSRLQRWWDSFRSAAPPALPSRQYPEFTLSAPLGDNRLIAKFDLLAVEPAQRLVIVDWKTSRRKPSHEKLMQRIQTKVYLFVATQAAAGLMGQETVKPSQVEMLYWFAEYPQEPKVFRYDEAAHGASRLLLQNLIGEIVSRDERTYPLTLDQKHCRFCVYRSLCSRGAEAGSTEDLDAGWDESLGEIDLDFGEIPQISR